MPRLSASPSTVALVGKAPLSSSVSDSRLCPFGSGSKVIVTTAPIRATKPTMALVSPRPNARQQTGQGVGSDEGSDLAGGCGCTVTGRADPDGEDLGGIDECRGVRSKLAEEVSSPKEHDERAHGGGRPRDEPQPEEGQADQNEPSGLHDPATETVDGPCRQQIGRKGEHGEDGENVGGLGDEAGVGSDQLDDEGTGNGCCRSRRDRTETRPPKRRLASAETGDRP